MFCWNEHGSTLPSDNMHHNHTLDMHRSWKICKTKLAGFQPRGNDVLALMRTSLSSEAKYIAGSLKYHRKHVSDISTSVHISSRSD